MPRHWQFLHGWVLCALLAVPAAGQHGVQWLPDIESAKAVAGQTGRLVLVHFWSPDCVPCRVLDMNVFNQPGVAAALNARFVPVKLNATENPATATGFGITRVPTDVVLTPQGQVICMLVSPPTPAAYVAEVTQVANQFASRSGGTYQRAVAAAPQPAQLNAAYANLHFDAARQAAMPVMPPSANPAEVSRAANKPRFPWMAAVSQSATPPVPTNQPQGHAVPYQQSPPAGQFVPGMNTTPGAQAWPATSMVPPTPAAGLPPAPTPYTPYPPSTGVAAGAPAIAPAPLQVANPHIAATTPGALAAAPTTPAGPIAAAQQPSLTTPQSPADARRLPPGAPPLGFDGYCPVSMRNLWKWVAGDPKWGAIHRGQTYWFAGQQEQQQFLADPDYYSPVLSGIDPVLALDHRVVVLGQRKHALEYDNRFYLFSSEATLQQFTSSPDRYAEQVRQAMGDTVGRVVR